MKFLNTLESANMVKLTPITSISATNVQAGIAELAGSFFAHKDNNGSDHSYINQDVKTTASPSFVNTTLSGSLKFSTFANIQYNSVSKTIDFIFN